MIYSINWCARQPKMDAHASRALGLFVRPLLSLPPIVRHRPTAQDVVCQRSHHPLMMATSTLHTETTAAAIVSRRWPVVFVLCDDVPPARRRPPPAGRPPTIVPIAPIVSYRIAYRPPSSAFVPTQSMCDLLRPKYVRPSKKSMCKVGPF